MRLNLDMNILRHMTDGVMVLDRYGQISAFNKVAEPWTDRCHAMSAAIKRLIDEERQGRLVLPLFIDLQLGQIKTLPQRADAWLCKNGPKEYAIFIVPLDPAAPISAPASRPANRQHNLLVLMGNEVREQLSALRLLINPNGNPHAVMPHDVAQHCKKVEQLMQEVIDLSQLLEHDEVFAGERLEIPDLIENTLIALSPDANQATVHLHTGPDPLGPVYGNGAWLSYALRLLIGWLIASALPRSAIHLTTRQMGDFLVLTGRAGGAHHGDAVPVSAHTKPDAEEQVGQDVASAQMMMCKRIIELHAGQLRLSGVHVEPPALATPHTIESFTLTLMTSMPASERSRASCADCRHVRQELSYASDMAQLIASTQTTISDRSLSHEKSTDC